jgi:dTDP-4-dehydrorhamnose reductase
LAAQAGSKQAGILVVGASGQLARSLVEVAPRYPQFDVTVLGRPSLNLLDGASTLRTLGAARPDWVINAAAYTAVDRAESESDLAFAVNRDGVRTIAAGAARHGAPVIHVSTDYVFDGRKQDAYVESDAVNPLGVYGRSKLEGEQQVAATNPRHFILRTSWVYSAHGANFVKTMLRLAAERPELRVVADQHGKPTHAGDLADAIFKLIERSASIVAGEAAWGTYHVAGQGATTWHGFAEGIVRASEKYGRPPVPVRAIETANFPTPAKRPANSVLDCGKLEATFGIALPHWTESLDRCLAELCGRS